MSNSILTPEDLQEITRLSSEAAREVLHSENFLDRDAADKLFDEKLEGTALRDASFKKQVLRQDSPTIKFFQALIEGNQAVLKDMAEGSATAGGYLVPTDFAGFLIEKLYKLPVLRPFLGVIPMTSTSENIPVEGNTFTVSWRNELAAIVQSDASFNNMQMTVHMLAGITRMSREFLADARTVGGRLDWLAGRFAMALGRGEDAAFMAGSGTGQPLGIRGVTSPNTVAQAGANLVYSDLVRLQYKLPYQYRSGAIYIAHDNIHLLAALLLDSTGRPMYETGIQSVIRDGVTYETLFGRPWLTQNDIPVNLGGGTNESELWYGRPDAGYLVGDWQQMSAETSTEEGTSFAQHRLALKVFERLDGQPTLGEMWAKLTAVK